MLHVADETGLPAAGTRVTVVDVDALEIGPWDGCLELEIARLAKMGETQIDLPQAGSAPVTVQVPIVTKRKARVRQVVGDGGESFLVLSSDGGPSTGKSLDVVLEIAARRIAPGETVHLNVPRDR